MRLVSIPLSKYAEYRLNIIFDGYKWDPQYLDNNTIARHALLITKKEADLLKKLTDKLSEETIRVENLLINNLKTAKKLALPRQTQRQLKKMSNYNPQKHTRLMRFDFHPVADGSFALSEVNSDVPGGFAESSLMPLFAIKALGKNNYSYINFGENLAQAIASKVKRGGKIAFVHCTSYSDDRQMVQFVGDKLTSMGYTAIYCAADHIKFENKKAVCILDGNYGELDGIFRFTPIEWCIGLKKTWHGYFDTLTPSCNHPAAVFAQTKRLPLIWDKLEKLGADLSAWRALLPDTISVKDAKYKTGYIFKPVAGRVGEGISIKEACAEGEYKKILKGVKRRPKKYVAQKMFNSLPLKTDEGDRLHICLGAYSVDGKFAGFYARASKAPRIDSYAADIAVLIEEDK